MAEGNLPVSIANVHPGCTELRDNLKWLIGLRFLVISFVAGSTLVLEIGVAHSLWSFPFFHLLIAGACLFTVLSALMLGWVQRLRLFAFGQIITDVLLETILVSATGGRFSPFTFLYLITIISACMILNRKGGMVTASCCGMFYGLVAALQVPGTFVSGFDGMVLQEALYSYLFNLVAFFTVAILSSNLAEKLRMTRQNLVEKETGLSDLKVFHENVVQSMNSGLLTADLKGRLTAFNQAAERITGLPCWKVKGHDVEEVLGCRGLGKYYRHPEKMDPCRLEDVEARRQDGRRLLLGVSLSPLRNRAGQVRGIVGNFQDVTRIREMEETMRQREKLVMVGELAAGMAHEIRNPLAAVSGCLQVLEKEVKPRDDHQPLMKIALREIDRLNQIVSGFLGFAHPLPLQHESCDLARLLREVIRLLRNSPEFHPDIKIQDCVPPDTVRVMADPNRMKQVFWNLCINAVQAMPHGGRLSIDLAVGTAQMPHPEIWELPGRQNGHDSAWVEIRVEDTGDGISPEDIPRVFDPFFTTKSTGSGLGLAIVQRIIEEHRGRIWAESEIKQGTCFHIRLPEGTLAEFPEATAHG